jgi:hypothetical protein
MLLFRGEWGFSLYKGWYIIEGLPGGDRFYMLPHNPKIKCQAYGHNQEMFYFRFRADVGIGPYLFYEREVHTTSRTFNTR